MSASYFNTAGTFIVDVNPLESNGPGNLSTPRQIVDVEVLDAAFVVPTDAFIVNDDVSSRFVQDFSFSVIGGPYEGAYTVDAGAFAPGATVCQVVGGQTHIPVSSLNPTYDTLPFYQAEPTVVISPISFEPSGYITMWHLDGNVVSTIQSTLSGSLPLQAAVITSRGTLYTNGTHTNVPLVSTTGVGAGAFATITVVGGYVTSVEVTTGGLGYVVGDSLTVGVGGTITSGSGLVVRAAFDALFKRISYNGVETTKKYAVFDVSSFTFDPDGIGPATPTTYTNVYAKVIDTITPVIDILPQSTFVTPYQDMSGLGYVQYTVSAYATSLMLVGKGAPLFNNTTSWGNAMQANMIHMMEHFAHTSPPVSPMNGQMWFDTTPGPTAGPALNLYSGATWYGVVAEGLPVQGNINMNNFKIANVTNATTTFPYVASSTGWGNNDQEVMNLGTSDALYIAKTGGYNADPLARSGTMTGSLNMSGTAGINFKAAGSGNLTFEATSTGSIVVDGSGSVTVATGNVVATAGNVRVGSGANQVVTQNNAGAAPTITFTTSTTGNNVVNLNNNMLTGLSNAVNPTDAVSQQYADGRYVNITGDTMTGALILNADPVVALGAATKQYVDNTTVSITGDTMTGALILNADPVAALGAATKQYVDNTSVSISGDTMTGALILNADPVVALGAATKQYVDMFVSGIIWLSPAYDNSLFNDSLSTPPVDDGYTAYHKSFIVAGTGTGAWAGFDGHLMQYNGSTWESVLGRPVAIGDRVGVFMEPDNDDPLSTLPGGGLTGHMGKIATVTGVSPYTYSFYVPAEPDAFTVVGVNVVGAAQSFHMGHSYTFRGTFGVGAYGTDYEWIEFLGPHTLIDGAGLAYAGQTLNVDGNLLSLYNLSTNGIIARTAANTVTARTITGTTGNIVVANGDGVANNPVINLETVTQGAVGTSFVKVALDGFGRVTNNTAVVASDITTLVDGTYVNVSGDTMTGALTLNADPTLALHAATKQYVDPARVMALAATVNGTVSASAKVLLAITAQAFSIEATPAANPCYGYADVTSTGSAVFDIQKNGVIVGSMTFSAGVNAAVFSFGSPVAFVAGDRIAVVAPGTPDATLADVYFTLRGTLA